MIKSALFFSLGIVSTAIFSYTFVCLLKGQLVSPTELVDTHQERVKLLMLIPFGLLLGEVMRRPAPKNPTNMPS